MIPKNRSVMRAFSILRAFHHEDEWVSVSEISRRAGLPFASTHRLLQTLEETGAVERAPNGSYRLGFLIASLSHKVDIADCLFKAARDSMTSLSQRLNISTFLGLLEGSMVTFIGRVLTPNSTRKYVTVGSQSAAHSLALGRVMLADMPLEELDELLADTEFAPFTPSTITTRMELAAELARVRNNGFAVEREQTYLGLGCVALPVRDDEGRVVAAISASEEIAKLTPERVETLRLELMKAIPLIRKKLLPSSMLASGRPTIAKSEVHDGTVS